jgi:hypothetical protein
MRDFIAVVKKDFKCQKGYNIPKDTILIIKKLIKNPNKNQEELFILINNGALKCLYPKTLILKDDLIYYCAYNEIKFIEWEAQEVLK